MEKPPQEIIAEFLDTVERYYRENYYLKEILKRNKVPNWQSQFAQMEENALLAQVIHERKFRPIFEQLRQAMTAEAVSSMLRSIEKEIPEG
jgi:hypothetical protein